MQENNNTNDTNSERTIANSETKKYEKGSFGWLKEQQKIKSQKAGFDNIDDWLKHKNNQGYLKNIDIVEKIVEENNIIIKDAEIFYGFWSKVDIKDNKEECWNWILYTEVTGYAQFGFNCKRAGVHRMSYMLTKGEIPDGLFVLHLCNNPSCCNPNHLELGDHSKNMQYRSKCGRCDMSGENNSQSKLTEDQVRDIHKIYNEQRKLHPGLKQLHITKPIAKNFKVTKKAIDMIINGTRWYYIYEEFHKK